MSVRGDYYYYTKEQHRAYQIWYKQRKRSGVLYGRDEFVKWWVAEIKNNCFKLPHCARLDHDKPYSFDNIVMQENSDNVKERNERRGNPGKSHRKIKSICTETGNILKYFSSKREAAKFYGVSEKTVFNHANGRTSQFFKFGIGIKGRNLSVRFEYA